LEVRRAIVSVSDKTGVVDFCRKLSKLGVEIISTGGTAKLLNKEGINVTHISDMTGFPEMLDGRVKTLHPKVHGGVLADRSKKDHLRQIKEAQIKPIDLVVVNIYPFKKTVEKENTTLKDAIENIDIGGPTLVRAAAKNHKHVGIVVSPGRYPEILTELLKHGGLSDKTRNLLALEAFRHTADYDTAISEYFAGVYAPDDRFPERLHLPFSKAYDLRYGENAHQEGAFYTEEKQAEPSISSAKQLLGEKKLSFNNILDLNDALELAREFDEPAAVIIKHTNPSGMAAGKTIHDAYVRAREVDPMSAFGCVVGLNRKADKETAEEIVSTFVEAVIAPGYTMEALEVLKTKKNLRAMDVGSLKVKPQPSLDYKRVVGGLLVHDRDIRKVTEKDLKAVTKRKPTKEEKKNMLFAWKICRHVKSNSIVFAKDGQTVGVGAGQMSRVDSVKIAAMKAKEQAKGAAMASDAFFPFRDALDEAAKAGITAVIHPGGSIRDQEVVDAADEHNLAMVFTGIRCFRH